MSLLLTWLALTASVTGLLLLVCRLSARCSLWCSAIILHVALLATFAAFALQEWVYGLCAVVSDIISPVRHPTRPAGSASSPAGPLSIRAEPATRPGSSPSPRAKAA